MTITAHGQVTDAAGWPLGGARVTVIDQMGAQLATATATADGRYHLDGLPTGAATVLVAAPGHDPQVRTVALTGPGLDVGTVQLGRTGVAGLPAPGIWVVDAAHSVVSAQARHLGISTIRGGFGDFAGIVAVADPFETSTTQIHIQAASVTTGNSMRDDHLRSPDFLDVENHPTITYVGHRLERRGTGWVVVGDLTMVGVTRPVTLDMTVEGTGPDPWGGVRAGFSATTLLHREDFRMRWNQAVGLGIDALGTTLRIDLQIEAVLQQ